MPLINTSYHLGALVLFVCNPCLASNFLPVVVKITPDYILQRYDCDLNYFVESVFAQYDNRGFVLNLDGWPGGIQI